MTTKQRFLGWFLSWLLVYAAQAALWAIGFSFWMLAPENQADTHWVLKMFGGFWMGLIIGLLPAGIVYAAAYAIPGGVLWATANENSIWFRFPSASIFFGSILGVSALAAFSIFFGDAAVNAWESWAFALIAGIFYGGGTAFSCLKIGKSMISKSAAA